MKFVIYSHFQGLSVDLRTLTMEMVSMGDGEGDYGAGLLGKMSNFALKEYCNCNFLPLHLLFPSPLEMNKIYSIGVVPTKDTLTLKSVQKKRKMHFLIQ